MPFDTYAHLKTAIADFLNRQDLTAVIPDFITLAEARVNRWLRTRDALNRATTEISAQFTELPDDFRGAKTIKLIVNGTEATFEYLTPDQMAARKASQGTATGQPAAYTFIGQSVEVLPVPDATYLAEMAYYRQVPALSDSSTSNWLLLKHPDIYLYGSLLQSAPYLKEDERIPVWKDFYETAQAEIVVEEQRASHGGGPLRMRTKGAIG